jgi:hypothetical protein
MIVGSSQVWKKNIIMPNFNLLLTVTSNINGILFALFNPVFVPDIRFITVNKYQKSVFFNTKYDRF